MTILCYHTVEQSWTSPLAVTPATFSEHCSWLERHKRAIALEDAVQRIDAAGRLPAGCVSLTFDDGFSGVGEHAAPLLRRHGLPATVFLVAETLSEQGRPIDWAATPPPTARTLSLDEVLELQDAGVRFQSHSFSHPDLRALSEQECVRDLRDAKELLESLVSRPVRFLAYPRGLHNEPVRRAAQKAGYTHAFSLPEGPEYVGRYAIPRAVVVPGNGLWSLTIKTSRRYLTMRRSPVFPACRAVARRVGLGLKSGV